MQSIDRARVQEILHTYKKECYLLEHSPDAHAQVEKLRDKLVAEILAANFHFHFHGPPDAKQAELLGMIDNYVREAVLPPVLTKLGERLVLLEKRHEAGMRCLEQIILMMDQG